MRFLVTVAACLVVAAAHAGEADIVAAEARQSADGTWSFDVTVAHADEGWDHYADAFDVLSMDGETLGQRILAHPHVNEQPFTRSLRGVVIDEQITQVKIVARDSVHAYGGAEMIVDLPR
ncbi:MAG: hypothetical protein WA921_04910 [Ahrensia sp.]